MLGMRVTPTAQGEWELVVLCADEDDARMALLDLITGMQTGQDPENDLAPE